MIWVGWGVAGSNTGQYARGLLSRRDGAQEHLDWWWFKRHQVPLGCIQTWLITTQARTCETPGCGLETNGRAMSQTLAVLACVTNVPVNVPRFCALLEVCHHKKWLWMSRFEKKKWKHISEVVMCRERRQQLSLMASFHVHHFPPLLHLSLFPFRRLFIFNSPSNLQRWF